LPALPLNRRVSKIAEGKATLAVLDALPQTQCTRCGYPDCAAYAQAVVTQLAGINQCPPGGAEGIARLAHITHQAPLPLSPSYGVEGPRSVAFIDEDWCIGCTLCIKVCPTDAIIGTHKTMHTVQEVFCTGCELCLPVCPVDCIVLENVTPGRTGWDAWSPALAQQARDRYAFKSIKTLSSRGKKANSSLTESQIGKTDVIAAALARARERRPSP
jgi:Na+-translocating ferredoxin:NAD+ oxidoreductase subunit B